MLDINEVMKLLPHRYPFLLIDKVVEIEAMKKIVAIKNVTANEPHFQGHFPGLPIMPGVLIVEAMAQACGIIMTYGNEDSGKLGVLTGIDGCKVRKQVIPGDILRIEGEILKERRGIVKAQAKTYVGDDLVCSAEITFALIDK